MLRTSIMRGLLLAAAASSLLLFLTSTSSLVSVNAALTPTPNTVSINGTQMWVNAAPFRIHGIAYSPVPVGENVNFPPYGDYFTPDYSYLWIRDLKQMKAIGINTIRIYAWKNDVNHTPFLDMCHQMGLKVMLTHYMGDKVHTPVATAADRQAAIDGFVNHVKKYGDHPAILTWSIGNELNGAWQGFRAEFSRINNCNWDFTLCENSKEPSNSTCWKSNQCVYTGLFTWINDIATAAKKVTTRPITSAFADVDYIVGDIPEVDKLSRFDSLFTSLDFHTIQLYRGHTFGDYFTSYSKYTKKPLLVGEFGVDAYNDPCGWDENMETMRPCYGGPATTENKQPGGADAHDGFVGCTSSDDCKEPGAVVQAKWDGDLAKELLGYPQVLGGIVVAWHDETWKGIGTQDMCTTPCSSDNYTLCSDPSNPEYQKYQMGGSAGCTWKAHITCSNYNTLYHDLCGYWLWSAPDKYVNEEWFGLNAAEDCGVSDMYQGHRLSALTPRLALNAMSTVYGGSGSLPAQTCDQLKPCWQCTRTNAATLLDGACDDLCGMKFKDAGYGQDVYPSTSSSTGGVSSSSGASSSGASSSSTGASSSTGSSTGASSSSGAGTNSTSSSSTGLTGGSSSSSSTGSPIGGTNSSSSSSTGSGGVGVDPNSASTMSTSLSWIISLFTALVAMKMTRQ